MASPAHNATHSSIKPIDKTSIHRITSGQVVIDLQTAVKELIENSLDAGATNIEVRFKQYGLVSIEVVDNGTGIAEEDYDSIGLKHHTSKLATYADLTELRSFGFRGEALSSLCALCQSVQITTSVHPPAGTCLDLDVSGRVKSRKMVARQKGTTVTLKGLFSTLPVRRKELERNIKREFAKALGMLHAYALLPCAVEPGVRLSVANQLDKGAKSQLLSTHGTPSMRTSVTALWGPKALDNIVDLDLSMEVERERGSRRVASQTLSSVDEEPLQVRVRGLISKFNVACGRNGTDRQFFYVNGRPCTLNKIQKTFNEVYRSFNATQSPFIIADFILPTDACDINVSPDKRTIFLHSEGNMITALKLALENHFNPTRSTFNVVPTQVKSAQTSLDQPSTSQLRVTVTNNMLRFCQRSATSSDGPDQFVSATPSSDIIAEPSNDQPDPTTETPLFIPDPDDDLPLAPPCVESSSDLQNEPMSIDSGSNNVQPQDDRERHDGEIVIDTTWASWNRQSSSQIISDSQETSTSTESTGEETNGLLRSLAERRDAIGGEDLDHDSDTEERSPKRQKSQPKTLEAWISTKPASISGKARGSSATGEVVTSGRLSTNGTRSTSQSKIREGKMSMHKFLSGFASGSQVGSRMKRAGEMVSEEVREDVEIGEGIEEEGGGEEERGVEEEGGEEERGVEEEEGVEEGQQLTPNSEIPAMDEVADASPSSIQSEGIQEQNLVRPPTEHGHAHSDAEVDDLDASSVLSSVQNSILSSSSVPREEPVSRPEIISSSVCNDITVKFSLDGIKANWSRFMTAKLADQLSIGRDDSDALEDAGLSNTENEARATEVLSRIIEKTDFSTMEVAGQFNLGFIIARRVKMDPLSGRTMDDLFIVDQHAADEKYNFENLQQTTNIQSQKLLQPRSLELTAAEELVATENIDVLRKNGFEIDMDETAPSGTRLTLIAQPVSKSTVFDIRDLEELIHLMRDRPNGQMVRCSKARTMFAMRACRKSIMIGMPLNRQQMQSVVRHMGTMDQPWNCPHGRPTMRHLADLDGVRRQVKEVDWKKLTTIP